MKGLAIASFILGIIGLLFSFVFGLGILPSILAVIFGIIPLIKKVLRSMAIPGLIMGLLGIVVSYSFFTLEPEDIIEQTIKNNINQEKEVNQLAKILPKKEKEFIDLSALELYKTLNKFTGLRQDEEWNKYKGKYLKWEAKLYPMEDPKISHVGVETRLLTNDNLKLCVSAWGPKYLFLKVIFNENEAEKLFAVREKDIISFTGKLSDAAIKWSTSNLKGYTFKLGNGKIVQIKRCKEKEK
jgi:hypothetical protein